MNQVEHSDHNTAAKEVFNFYSKLYSLSFSPSKSNSLFQMINNNTPSIDRIFIEVCESEITIQEQEQGPDGLTTDIYNCLEGPNISLVGRVTGVYKE